MQRKIIQLAIMPEGDMTQPAVIGLCDDGSVMVLSESKSYWTELPPIPQKPIERNFIGQTQLEHNPHYQEGYKRGLTGMPSQKPVTPQSASEAYTLGYQCGLEKTKL